MTAVPERSIETKPPFPLKAYWPMLPSAEGNDTDVSELEEKVPSFIAVTPVPERWAEPMGEFAKLHMRHVEPQLSRSIMQHSAVGKRARSMFVHAR